MKFCLFDLQQDFWPKIQVAVLGPRELWPSNDVTYRYLFSSKGSDTGVRLPSSGRLEVDVAIIFAYRIPEICLMILNPSVQFIYVQHGYYTLEMARTGAGVIRKLDRIMAYLWLCLMVALRRPATIIPLIKYVLRVWTTSRGMAGESAPASPALALVQGSHWVAWHKTKIGWGKSTYLLKPYFERKPIRPLEEEGAWQYICQSLVEDGRIGRSEIRKAMLRFIANRKPTKLYLVAHPRSDRSLYVDLGVPCEFVTNCIYTLPTAGHYSSLLIYAKQFGLGVDILPFEHHKIPNDFMEVISKPAEEIGAYLKYTTNANESFIWPFLDKL